jgi:dTDP-4-dehydrorhamnose reductase
MDDYAIRYPTYTPDVADVMGFLLRKNATGCFHFSGNEAMTKFEMVRRIAHLKGLSSEHIAPEKNPPDNGTIRPISSHLDCTKLNQLGYTDRTPFQTGIRDTLKSW